LVTNASLATERARKNAGTLFADSNSELRNSNN